MITSTSILSKTITYLRFPLIIAVVFIHTQLGDTIINGMSVAGENNFLIHNLLFHIITNELARIAVPLFFFMSGFLFFYKTDTFNLDSYIKKLKKRFRSLLIPYIFWNIVVVLLFFLSQLFLSSLLSGKNKLIVDYSIIDWLNILWDKGDGSPICYQFWFIRDLIVVVLLSPLVYYFIKYIKIYGVILLGMLWTFGLWFDVVGFSITSFFFFSFGAWFSINKRDFTIDFNKYRSSSTIIYLILLIVNTIIWYNNIENLGFVHNIGILVGIVTVISWTAFGLEKNKIKPSTLLAGSSFFVYAYHGMPIALLIKVYMKLTAPFISEFTMIAGYLIIPFIIVSIGVGVYAILHKHLPRFTAFITGGR